MNALDGNGRQQCTECNHRSIAGLVRGKGKCPFHWAAGVWSLQWASKCYPEHPNAIPETEKGDAA